MKTRSGLIVFFIASFLTACGSRPTANEAFRSVIRQEIPSAATVEIYDFDTFQVFGMIQDSESIKLVLTLPEGDGEQLLANATHLQEVESVPDHFLDESRQRWSADEHRFWIPRENRSGDAFQLVVLHQPSNRLLILSEDVQ